MFHEDPDKSLTTSKLELVPYESYRTLPLPELPSSSGALGTRLRILTKDTTYVRQHADFLNARISQAQAIGALIEARIAIALTLSKLAHLDEIVATEYLKGKRKRASELRLVHLRCEKDETEAAEQLAIARKKLNDTAPQPRPAAAQPVAGLSPGEIDELLADLPEISKATRETVLNLVKGRVEEKS